MRPLVLQTSRVFYAHQDCQLVQAAAKLQAMRFVEAATRVVREMFYQSKYTLYCCICTRNISVILYMNEKIYAARNCRVPVEQLSKQRIQGVIDSTRTPDFNYDSSALYREYKALVLLAELWKLLGGKAAKRVHPLLHMFIMKIKALVTRDER